MGIFDDDRKKHEFTGFVTHEGLKTGDGREMEHNEPLGEITSVEMTDTGLTIKMTATKTGLTFFNQLHNYDSVKEALDAYSEGRITINQLRAKKAARLEYLCGMFHDVYEEEMLQQHMIEPYQRQEWSELDTLTKEPTRAAMRALLEELGEEL